ncbi:glycosyltransferase family 25 protein [Xenorhabdus sp. KK7.4]|uniref:glycosyltransferase family 25 protein n=1 Tax=Xenorhabdus sp. KK7.4 TaxID=1851572 RepID=UPI000C040B0C|nr:glycosyltransferase family 25 protein [Xenorhabdus sp. KK7.4]PHM51032.1 lipooligosaccharide galactosyltransferase I [Xenorhabdus sp. KK7.4]
MKIFVINLKKDINRRESIQQQADELDLQINFIDAINGKDLSENEIKNLSQDFYSNGMTLGELGCSLSHISIYHKMINENIPLALILEDDAKLNKRLKHVYTLISNYNKKNRNKPIVYLLSKTNEYIDTFKIKLSDTYALVNVIDADFAYGYMINNLSAKRLLNFLQPVWIEADKWRFLQERGIVKIKGLIPPIIGVTELSQQSTLEKERYINEESRINFFNQERKKRNLKTRVKNVLWKIFIRHWVKRIRP